MPIKESVNFDTFKIYLKFLFCTFSYFLRLWSEALKAFERSVVSRSAHYVDKTPSTAWRVQASVLST